MPPSFWIVFFIFVVVGAKRSIEKWNGSVSLNGLDLWLYDHRVSIAAAVIAVALLCFLWRIRRSPGAEGVMENPATRMHGAPPSPHSASPSETEPIAVSKLELVLLLEETRQQRGLKPGWLFYRCEQLELLDEYVRLLREGLIPNESFVEAWRGRFAESSAIKAPALPPVRDPYEILKVTKGCSWKEIQASYRTLMQQHHPDKFHFAALEIQNCAKELTARINEAYRVLESEYRARGLGTRAAMGI